MKHTALGCLVVVTFMIAYNVLCRWMVHAEIAPMIRGSVWFN